MGTLWLPDASNKPVHVDNVTSVVIVGANGSGKSRLGAWMDSLDSGTVVHRISAQRALMIEDIIRPRPLDQAMRRVLYGSDNPDHHKQKHIFRWNSNPIGHYLNDFEDLLALLLADHAKTAISFREQYLASPTQQLANIKSKLERVVEIWKTIMPQRELIIRDDKVSARLSEGTTYAGKEMSDGERVALYLIAQCLIAPDNATIIIDEPELHLHQAIHINLWDKIEASRTDCVFVYITHDLSFAASRIAARKFWIRAYDGKCWDIQEIQTENSLPEALTFQILGCRKPILFVEGEKNKFDVTFYQLIFPERQVIARGNCDAVLTSTIALRSLSRLHHMNAYGIIDRDHRSDDQIASFQEKGVFATAVAEVENFFLIPDAVQYVSRRQRRNPSVDLAAIQDKLFAALVNGLRGQIRDRATYQIQQRLNSFSGPERGNIDSDKFNSAVTNYLDSIDPVNVYNESERLFQDILDSRDYLRLLRYFNQKNLHSIAAKHLGFQRDEYVELILRDLQEPNCASLRDAFRAWIPAIIPADCGCD